MAGRFALLLIPGLMALAPMVSAAAPVLHDGTARPEQADRLVIPLPLKGLVREVLKRNSSLLLETIQLKASEHRVDYEREIFIPEFSTQLSYHDTDSPNNTAETLSRGGLDTYAEDQWSVTTGLEGVLPSGATWDFKYVQSRTSSSLIDQLRAYDREYESQLKLTLRQPLLRGAGSRIVRSEYRKAGLDRDMQAQAVVKTATQLVALAAREYWKLHGAQQLIESLQKSVTLLKESEAHLKKKLEAGEVAEEQLLEARSSRIAREVELAGMRHNATQSSHTLMSFLNLDLPERHDYRFVTEDVRGDAPWENVDFEAAFEKMKANWPDFKIAQAKLERAQVEYEKKQNEARPNLDLVVGGWLSNLDDQALAEASVDSDFPSWQVGLEFSMPLWSGRQKSAVAIAARTVDQARSELDSLERNARIELKMLLRSMQSASEQLAMMRSASQLKEQLLQDEFKKFQFGEVTVRDVIEKEDEVSLYQRKIVNQLIASKISRIDFDKYMGVILATYCPDQDIFAERPQAQGRGSDIDEDTFR